MLAEHLQDIAEEKCGVALLGEIERFLHFQFLFWLEVMSLREWISVAVTGLQTLTQWLKVFHSFIHPGWHYLIPADMILLDLFQKAISLCR